MDQPADSTPPAPKANGQSAWPRAVMWMVVVFLFLAAGLYVFKSIRDLPGEMVKGMGNAVEKAGKAAADVASAFKKGTITTSFVSYATTLHPNQFLQFATLKQQEIFSRSDQTTTAFGYLPLPEVIIEARAPVEYTYYLDLNESWQFITRDGVIYILAPPIKFNKPSVDVSALNFEVRKGSMFRNTGAAQEDLKKTITLMAHTKARQNIPLVKDTARKQTTEFVETWVRKSFHDGTRYPVKVFFPGETLPLGIQFPAQTNAVAPPLN